MEMNMFLSQMEQELFKKAWDCIEKAQKITLLTHYNPDGDGVSACAALDHVLRAKGKEVETIYPTPLKLFIKRQPATVLVNRHDQLPDLVIICDTANYERLYYPAAFHDIPSINIDHHISSSIKPTFNFVDGNATSTCDYLYRLLYSLDQSLIERFVAECLLYGILYDTQSFSIQSTSSQVLRIAADLVDRGAPYGTLTQELRYHKTPEEIKLWGALLAGVSTNASGELAWLVMRQKDLKATGLSLAAIAGLENFIAHLAAANVTILFYEDEQGRSKASFRSKTADVNAVAKLFGGGGHKFAAGLMTAEPLDVLIPKVVACFA